MIRGLTTEELKQYDEQGFVVAKGILLDEDFKQFETDYGYLIDKKAEELQRAGHIKSTHKDKVFDKRLACIAADCSDEVIKDEIGPFGLSLDTMYALQKGLFELLFNQRLIKAVSTIVGEEVLLNPIQHCRPFLPARNGKQSCVGAANLAPWHQDQGVTREEADASEILTCWIPLTDVSDASGCMPLKVMPEVFKDGLLEHVKSDQGTTIKPDLLRPNARTVSAEMKRGDILLMNRFTPHCSQINTSDRVRWSLDLRFQKIGTPTGRPFWPSFILQSPSNPDSVQNSYDEWCARWKADLASSVGERWHRVIGDVGGSINGESTHSEKKVTKAMSKAVHVTIEGEPHKRRKTFDWRGFQRHEISGFQKPLLLAVGSKGTAACAYLSIAAADKLGDAFVLFSGVSSCEDFLDKGCVGVSKIAADLGVTVGMLGRDVLEKLR